MSILLAVELWVIVGIIFTELAIPSFSEFMKDKKSSVTFTYLMIIFMAPIAGLLGTIIGLYRNLFD